MPAEVVDNGTKVLLDMAEYQAWATRAQRNAELEMCVLWAWVLVHPERYEEILEMAYDNFVHSAANFIAELGKLGGG